MGQLLSYPKFKAHSATGVALSGGKLYTYTAGTTTPKATYSDAALTTPNANPVVLDTNGEAVVWLDGSYYLVLKDSDDVEQWTMDDVSALGADVTATAAELNYNDITTLGVSEDSKVVTQAANGTIVIGVTAGNEIIDIASHDLVDGGLKLAGTLVTASAAELNILDGVTASAAELNLLDGITMYGRFDRGIFTYNGGSTAYTVKVKPGNYYCKDKYCQWISELTTGAIDTPVASTRYYLYLDYSAITSGTAITASELVWSSDPPAYSTTYRQWIRTVTNTDDRCIFGVKTNPGPTNIYPFYHDGDYIQLTEDLSLRAVADLDNSFADVDASSFAPVFSTRIRVNMLLAVKTANAVVRVYWTIKDAAMDKTFMALERIGTDQSALVSGQVMTNSTQVFEVKTSRAGDDTLGISIDGWYFPIGM